MLNKIIVSIYSYILFFLICKSNFLKLQIKNTDCLSSSIFFYGLKKPILIQYFIYNQITQLVHIKLYDCVYKLKLPFILI